MSPRCWEWTTGRGRGVPSGPSRSGTGSFSSASPGAFQQVPREQTNQFIPDPDFDPSRIPDPKTAIKEKGDKKLVVIPIL